MKFCLDCCTGVSKCEDWITQGQIQNPPHHFGINAVNWYLCTHHHSLLYKSINKIVLSADKEKHEEQHWPIESDLILLILWGNENRVWFSYVYYKSEQVGFFNVFISSIFSFQYSSAEQKHKSVYLRFGWMSLLVEKGWDFTSLKYNRF